MSVICQTFVQNTWRKDLCSNCFKSKEEHGGGGGGGEGVNDGGHKDDDIGFSRSRNGTEGGGGGGSRRYMGVAGRVYQRGYYNNNWKSIMIDKSDSALGSPEIMRSVSKLVSQENQKNLMLSDMVTSQEKEGLRSSRLVQQVKTSQSEARLLTELLGDKNEDEEKNEKEESKYKEDRGDVSSDLGSEASNDGSSTSSPTSTCSYQVSYSAVNSDTSSLESEGGSDNFGEDKMEDTRVKEDTHSPTPSPQRSPVSILKHSGAPKGKRGSITFNPKLEEIIGYGGDVDYDDDDDDIEDDDDDYDKLADLTPDERALRQLTDKNTEFNSDNDNLKKDIDELLPSVEELEEKRKMIIAEIEALEKLGRENRLKNEKAKQEEKKDDKQEAKVKLKRSPPLVSTKPLIARNNNDLRVNQVLPMKNGEVVRTGIPEDGEEVPLKGIKPKYVAREDEMVEKSSVLEGELKTNMGKITSIDEVFLQEQTKKVKVTSIDDMCVPVVDETVKSAEVRQETQVNTVNIDDSQHDETQEDIAVETSFNSDCERESSPSSLSPPSLSPSSDLGTPSPVAPSEGTPSHKVQQNQNTLNKDVDSAKPCTLTKGSSSAVGSETENPTRKAPVSSPRKSLMGHSQRQATNDPVQLTTPENPKTSPKGSPPGTCKPRTSPNLTASSKSPSPIECHKKIETSSRGASVIPGNMILKSSSALVQQKLFDDIKPGVERELNVDSKTSNGKDEEKLAKPHSAESSTEGTRNSSKQRTESLTHSQDHSHQDTSTTLSSESLPIPSGNISNQTIQEPSSSTYQIQPESCKTTINQGLPESFRALSNQNLSETNRVLPNQRLPEVPRKPSSNKNNLELNKTSSNRDLQQYTLRTPSNYSHIQISRTLSNQITSDTLGNLSDHSHAEASRTQSNQSLPGTFSDQSLPETPRSSCSDQSLPENPKTPASRQGSTSSLMTTFGTPILISTTSPQNSFLHSSPTRNMYDDTYNSPSAMHTQETSDFLRDIKSQPEVPTPTAGIQKSALYASTSCLKGLPGAKPVITPKPPILRDKPKVPLKPPGSRSRIYATPSPITPKVPIGNLSGAISTPNLSTLHAEDRAETASSASGALEASSPSQPEGRPGLVYKLTAEQKKPPPTMQAPSVPSLGGRHPVEAVYDVPVTIVSSASTTRNSSSSGSSCETKHDDDVTIYHEIDDSIKANTNCDMELGQGSLESPLASRQESTRHQSRSTFEANRSLLSAALDFGTKATRSSSNKRSAPRPPAGEEEQEHFGPTETLEDTTPLVTQLSVPLETSSPKEAHSESPQETSAAIQGDSNDGESYSSFTDDFDDDDDDDEEEEEGDVEHPTLRKAERSSSAVPFYRNSIGAIGTNEIKAMYDCPSALGMMSASPLGSQVYQVPSMVPSGSPVPCKPLATRSHSVPRNTDHVVNMAPNMAGTGFHAPTSSSSSKFSFGRSGFFRPASPPTAKRDSSSDRGRDRSNKKTSSSRFSLKKLLRLGGGGGKDEERRAVKEQEKRLARDAKKGRLTIIHPLDYNQNGVQVIARPEKTSPIYDYTGIYGYIPPPQLSAKLEDPSASTIQASPAPSLASKRSEASHGSSSLGGSSVTVPPAASLPLGSVATTINTTSVSLTTPITIPMTVSASACTSSPLVTATTTTAAASPLQKNSSFLRRECGVERRESGTSFTSTSSPHHHLGYNSEGRPKPPPPPRKVSLEGVQAGDLYSTLSDLTPSTSCDLTHARLHDHSSTTDMPARPQRPPPPTRTLSNAGTKAGPPRPEPPKLTKDSVYANLGDVRAPFTPRKPGRTASIRGEDDREKRRAPQPPQLLQQAAQEAAQQATQRLGRHQKQDSTSSSCSSMSSARAAKGPAPARPQHLASDDYDTTGSDDVSVVNKNWLLCSNCTNTWQRGGGLRSSSPVLYDTPLPPEARPKSPQDVQTPDGYIIPAQLPLSTVVTQIAVGASTCTLTSSSCYSEDVYQTPRRGYHIEDTTSALSSRQEKTGRLSVRRTSAITHRSLEDQYGAVISANLEALSNMLDQLCNNCCPAGYEDITSGVSRWEDVAIDDDIIVGAGHRLFYVGEVRGREVILMLTPETKVDAHHLLTPMPLATFKDELPSHLLSHKYITRGKSTHGTVWVLPLLSLTTLRTIAEEDVPQLSSVPAEWERNTCLLLLQLVTGLKQLQAQGVEETCIDLTLVVRGSQTKGQDCDPRLILVPPTETGSSLMSLCECAAAATLLLMGVNDPLECAREGNFTIPSSVPSQHAFNILLQLLHQERAGSLTQVKCVLEVLLFGPDSSGCDAKEGEEVEAALQRWLDLERATVLHTLIRGPLESSVLTKFHLLFLVRTNSRVLRETIKLLGDPEVTTF
nr:mucin-4-like isoform X3 [Procambarus clarkii]